MSAGNGKEAANSFQLWLAIADTCKDQPAIFAEELRSKLGFRGGLELKFTSTV